MSIEFRRHGLTLYAIKDWDTGTAWLAKGKKWLSVSPATVREVKMDGRVLTEAEAKDQFPAADLAGAN